MKTVTGPDPVAVPVSVGVGVSTVAATVGPVIATAGASDVTPVGQALGGVVGINAVSVRLSMKTALS